MKKNWRNHGSTIIGAVVAIANAWLTIDWENFNKKSDLPKLILSGVIALGGFLTSINKREKRKEEDATV